jgi:hypothetical protein
LVVDGTRVKNSSRRPLLGALLYRSTADAAVAAELAELGDTECLAGLGLDLLGLTSGNACLSGHVGGSAENVEA